VDRLLNPPAVRSTVAMASQVPPACSPPPWSAQASTMRLVLVAVRWLTSPARLRGELPRWSCGQRAVGFGIGSASRASLA
jgi:hypothetical protein